MRLEFSGPMWFWRGPSPYHFVTVPEAASAAIASAASLVTYGWGMIPVRGRIGETDFRTSLWPKDGGYIVPIKNAVRFAEQLELDDRVGIVLEIDAD